MKTRIAVLALDKRFTTSFDSDMRSELFELGWDGKTLGEEASKAKAKQLIRGVDVAVTSWDSVAFDSEILSCAPDLRLICHAAGSVKCILCPEVWKKHIVVTSAAPAIAAGVGEHCLGLMLSAMKNNYVLNNQMKANRSTEEDRQRIIETYGATIGIVGCGFTGRRFIKLLSVLDLDIVVYDPYMTPEDADAFGVKQLELADLMKCSDVVALHVPESPGARHIINADNLRLLKDHAIIVNTVSGSLIDEQALVAELKKRPIIAALDVTDPEPPLPDSELRRLPNVILTPHIAGVVASNRFRIGNMVVEEINRFIQGKPQLNEVAHEGLTFTT